MELQQYWQAIRSRVCEKCVDGDGHGNCRIDPSIECALQKYLPLIVQAVEKIKSDQMEDYVRELRMITCSQCQYQTVNGYCVVRDQVDCALDRYFPLVVEAIEEVKKTSHT